MRILCLLFPRLGLQLLQRHRPNLQARPLVLLQGHGEDALVSGASCDAAARGLLVGMTAAEARRYVPGARFLPDNAGDCLDELERLADIIRRRATPLVEIAGRDHLFVDLSRLAAGEQRESQAAETLLRLVQAFSELSVRAGVASTRKEALEAARAARVRPLLLAPSPVGATERPIAPHRSETIAVTVAGASESALRLKLAGALRRLDAILEARSASARELSITIANPGGDHEIALRFRTPVTSTGEVQHLLEGASDLLEEAAAVRIELGRLGPDVRVRPCIASTAHRPARGPQELRRPLLRAG